jgi:penicillin-binding protein 1A
MDPLIVKILATALTFSQVLIAPESLKTRFDPAHDRSEVVQWLQKGCAHMRKAFKIDDFNLDDLVATAMDDRDAASAKFKDISFADLHLTYRGLCNGERVKLPFDIGNVIEFYNRALEDLPQLSEVQGLKLPGTTIVLDRQGEKFAEVYEPANRRISVPLNSVSPHVLRAFIAAEDKRFYEHRGVDEHGLIRAFIANLAETGPLQGGSTITQQVAKNLLVGTQTSYVRKIREMVMAARMERALTKSAILELYLNSVYLGRGAWGIEMAARSYFGKGADTLSIPEAALLAGLVKGPNFYDPDRYLDRARQRFTYVLHRMREDGAIEPGDIGSSQGELPTVIARAQGRRDRGYHFIDLVAREAKQVADIKFLTEDTYVIRSTIDGKLQKAAETALQEGLAAYEQRSGRAKFEAAEANLADTVSKIEKRGIDMLDMPAWQRALQTARLPLYDVHWTSAVILDDPRTQRQAGTLRVGLVDGRILPMAVSKSVRGRLNLHDVVYVRIVATANASARAELRVRPQVQGAVVVLENKTGRILASVGGFSYPLSQLNRTTQAQRQPGSALKPLTYLAALAKGLQPNTFVRDSPITLPPIGVRGRAKANDYWSPQNYDGSVRSTITMRQALETSRNLATVHLLAKGIANSPEAGLDKVCQLATEAQVYRNCARYYSLVLGAQPVRPLDLARFYAAIANDGLMPEPHAIDLISHRGQVLFEYDDSKLKRIDSADAAAFYQLRSMMQGVVQRGTAARMAELAPYIAGKTGTTDEETDAWFVGFSNDVTIAVWVGYDNARRKRTLGGGRTGANVAVPIFEPIMRAVWQHHSPMTALAPPSPDAMRVLTAVASGGPSGFRRGGSNVEYLRKDAKGKAIETRYALVSRPEESGVRHRSLMDPHNAHASAAYGAEPNFFSWFGQERRSDPRTPTNSFFGGGGSTQPSGRPQSPFQFHFR